MLRTGLLVCSLVFLLLAPAKRDLPPNHWKPLHKHGIPCHNLSFSGHIHFQTSLEKNQTNIPLKFGYSEKATNIWKKIHKIFLNFKLWMSNKIGRFFQIYVAFLEYLKFSARKILYSMKKKNKAADIFYINSI